MCQIKFTFNGERTSKKCINSYFYHLFLYKRKDDKEKKKKP